LSKAEPLRIRLLGPEGAPVTTGQTSIWHWYRWPNNAGGSGQGQRPFPESGVVNFDPPDNVDELKEAFIGIQVEGIGLGQWRLEKWPDNAGASTFRLSAGATLVGTVVNANGAPLPNTKVTLSAHIEKPIFYGLDEKGKWEDPLPVTGGDPFFAVSDRHAFTDRDGRFTFSFLPYGGYEVRAAIPDVGVRYAAVEVNRPKVEASLSPADQSSTKARFADR
jgi:hypothetical protein